MASSFQGVSIDPVQLKSGALRAAFDPLTNPGTTGYGANVLTGTAKAGTMTSPVLSTPVVASSGGTLAAGVYGYRVSAVSGGGEGVPCVSQTATTTGTTSQVTLTFTAPVGEVSGFKVYRDSVHLADVAHGTLTFVDDGSLTPAGAIPSVFPGGSSAEGDLAPRPKDGGSQTAFGENAADFAHQTKAPGF